MSRFMPGLLLGGVMGGVVFLLAGCSAARYRAAADREAYRLIGDKAAKVKNMEPGFSIESTNRWTMDRLPASGVEAPFLGDYGAGEKGARVVTLASALGVATEKSRVFQSRREQLYMSSLSLSLARHQWTPLFSAGGRTSFDVDTQQALDLVPDPSNPSQPKTILSDTLVEQHRVRSSGSVGAGWLIRDVGRISTAFTTDFLRFLTGDPRSLTRSQVGATFVRPLLQNAGFKAQIENLTQAERDLLYEVRDFTRFRKEFSVQIASSYYAVLGNRDAARNAHANLQSSLRNTERTRALAAEGRVAQAELGRLEQQQLTAENAWLSSVRAYRQGLDDLKLQLGVSVDINLVLDDAELDGLQIRHPDIALEDAIEVALAARLDYQNTKEQYEDSARKVSVARSALKTKVDLVADVGINSGADTGRGFPLPDPKRYNWSAGLDVDLPLDRKAERNAYRGSLIAVDRAARELTLKEDQIKIQVRDGWRVLEQARRGYEIADLGVKLAQRRVEEQNLLAQLGRAKAQDQVDAQNSLNDSRNQRTQALVTHTIARLQFWNNMGILYIKENGAWEEGRPSDKP